MKIQNKTFSRLNVIFIILVICLGAALMKARFEIKKMNDSFGYTLIGNASALKCLREKRVTDCENILVDVLGYMVRRRDVSSPGEMSWDSIDAQFKGWGFEGLLP